MEHPGFFENAGPYSVGDLLKQAEARPGPDVDTDMDIHDVRPLDAAGHQGLGSAYEALGRPEEARRHYRAARASEEEESSNQ